MSLARRPADGADVPDRDAGRERLQRRRALVRRAPHRQRRHADRRADRVPHLPDADPDVGDDGHLHVHDGAARRGLRRAHPGGAGHRVQRRAAGRRRSPSCAGTASWSCAASSFRYPGAEEPVLQRRRPGRPARRDHRGHRLAPAAARPRCSTWSRGCSTRPAARCWSTASTCASSTRRCWPRTVGLVPQKPYLFSGTVASNLRYGKPGRHRRGAVARPGGRAGHGLRRAHGRRPGRADRAGRHQRLRRPAAAAGDRPGAGAPAGDLPLRRLLLRAGLRHRRGAAGRAGARRPPRRPW